MVAGEKQLPTALVPDGGMRSRRVMVDAILAPGAVGIEQKPAIADGTRISTAQPERRDQVGTVVEPHIGHDHVPGQ